MPILWGIVKDMSLIQEIRVSCHRLTRSVR